MQLTDRTRVPEAGNRPDRLAFKTAESQAGQMVSLDDAEGIVTAIVSVTGTVDEVNDIIVPGAYRETLVKRRPKVCWAHSWEHPIGRVLHIEELMPGDERLPQQTKDGAPWPAAAGALVATMQFNMRTAEGKQAFEAVRFYSESGECEYSIGYQVPPGRSTRDGAGTRHIKSLDLYELSVVLFGAHTMTGTISVKEAIAEAMQRKGRHPGTGTVGNATGPHLRVTAADRLAAAREGKRMSAEDRHRKPTMPGTDDKFPIGNREDLQNAIRLAGNSSEDRDKVRAWIRKRARDLDLTNLIPESWSSDGKALDGKGLPDFSDGVMIALYPDPAAADRIAEAIAGTDETVAKENLHVTLAYLGDTGSVDTTSDELVKIITEAVEGEAALSGTIGGIGQFPAAEDSDDGAPTWLPVDVPGLTLLRETVANALGDRVDHEHGFTPHMTIGWDVGVIDPIPSIPVTFTSVHVVYGDQHREVSLRTVPEEKSMNTRLLYLSVDEVAALTALDVRKHPSEAKAGGADRNRGNAEELRRYWTVGAGGAKIRWGTSGDFTRCVRLLTEHMTPERAKGYCFTGETEVITRDGVATLADLAGTDPVLLTQDAPTSPHGSPVRRDGRWVQAPVRSYGEQSVLRVTLRRGQDRKVIGATPEHEWFASPDARSAARKRAQRLTTADLRPGMALTALMPGAGGAVRSMPSPFGVAAGVVFGDGHVQPGKGALVDLWDEKDAHLLRYFEHSRQEPRKTASGVLGVRVSGLPASWKAAPTLDEGTSYLYGWLAGYIAADGTVGERGNVTLSSANPDHLRHAAAVAHRLGIATHPIKGHDRFGLGTAPTTLHRMTFVGTTVPADLLVLPEHKRRFEAATPRHEAVRWVVESVEDHGEREEVFCADVPDTHTFALADYLWVANCANRHKEMTGMWPGDRDNKGYDPTLDNKAAVPVPAGKGYPRLPGSYEERADALMSAVVEALRGDLLDEEEGRWEWPGVCVDATFEDRVIATRHKYDGTDTSETFEMSYEFTPDGVDLGDPERVELQVVAVDVRESDVDGDLYLADDLPLAEGVYQIAHAVKVAHDASMEAKAGRVLSGSNERALRAAVERLVDVLASAGVKISLREDQTLDETRDDANGVRRSDPRKEPPPEADLTTTAPSANTKGMPIPQPDGTFVITRDELDATLAAYLD